MRRRDVITFFSGAAVAWPLGARAQQPSGMRLIGILMPFAKSDVGTQANVRVFRQELARLGWTEGGNVQFDEHWSTDNMDLVRADAANLVALNPDVIVIVGDRVIPVLTKLTRSIPIVVASTSDPIASGAGAVESLARPGHNVTGFSLIEFSIFGKMLEILKSLAPGISRVGMMYNPDNPVGADYLRAFETAAEQLAVQPINLPIHDLPDVERGIASLAEHRMVVFFFRQTLRSCRFTRRCRPCWHAIACQQSPYIRRLRQPEDWSPTVRIETRCFVNPLPTSTVFCAAKNRAICHFSSLRDTGSSSTSKPPRRSVSKFQRRSCCAPTR